MGGFTEEVTFELGVCAEPLKTSHRSLPQNSACPIQEEEAVAWERGAIGPSGKAPL